MSVHNRNIGQGRLQGKSWIFGFNETVHCYNRGKLVAFDNNCFSNCRQLRPENADNSQRLCCCTCYSRRVWFIRMHVWMYMHNTPINCVLWWDNSYTYTQNVIWNPRWIMKTQFICDIEVLNNVMLERCSLLCCLIASLRIVINISQVNPFYFTSLYICNNGIFNK